MWSQMKLYNQPITIISKVDQIVFCSQDCDIPLAMQSNFKISSLQKLRNAQCALFYGIESHLNFSVLTIFHDLNSEKINLSKTQSLINSEAKTFRELNFPQLKVLGDLHS